MKIGFMISMLLASAVLKGQQPFLSDLKADKDYPLFTTYTAAMERSSFLLDQGYRFRYYTDTAGADFITDTGGDIALSFEMNGKTVYRTMEMTQAPVITCSYPDLVKYELSPFPGIKVQGFFLVQHSAIALLDITVINETGTACDITARPFLRGPKSGISDVRTESGTLSFTHVEKPDKWTLQHNVPYTDSIRNFWMSSRADGMIEAAGTGTLGFAHALHIPAGGQTSFRVLRAVAPLKSDAGKLIKQSRKLLHADLQPYVRANEKLFAKTPSLPFKDEVKQALYWSANNMMRQVFYPAEGKSKYNYYVFSREPTWGWGHGGQVFHESITMLAYAYIDPVSAMNSQRVYSSRQHSNGYINYRTGGFLDEVIEHKGQLTSSAPWYAWLNWEVYKITKSRKFLKEMYTSSKRFYNFYTANRDTDNDGLCEWGGHAVLESVRDAKVAVWDQVGWPAEFESLDLNCMLVMEAKSLEKMAATLGLEDEAAQWKADHTKRAALVNQTFWDEKNGFYYNVDKTSHTFTYKKQDDLKRDEIIGFLPLWAGIADEQRAARLVKKLTDTAQFWRPFGVPSLSAADPYYDPKGYWNGPVWVEWNYLIMQGLIDYGYKKEAKELVDRVADVMIRVLRKDHDLWEFYSPDHDWGGYHRTYIWAGIINRMMLDTADKTSEQ